MSIKVATIIGDNYGSVLQAFGLQFTLKKIGGNPELIWLEPKSYTLKFLRTYIIPNKNENFKKKMYKLISDFANRKKRHKVKLFYENNITLKRYKNIKELKNDCRKGDTLICGSDQVWNPQFINSSLYYLDFINDCDIKKYSYAASLAVDNLNESQKKHYINKLSYFQKISVREKSGLDILSDLSIGEIRVDIDPVLLLTAEEWNKIKSYRFENQSYVFLYMLRPMKELFNYAKQYAKDHNLKLIYIGDYKIYDNQVECCHDAGVEDFLSAIYYADTIITNSFHGTVFSTIFHKNFISYAVTKTGSRVRDYLSSLNLTNHLLVNFAKHCATDDEIDWKEIDKLLNEKRSISFNYLQKIVNNKKGV